MHATRCPLPVLLITVRRNIIPRLLFCPRRLIVNNNTSTSLHRVLPATISARRRRCSIYPVCITAILPRLFRPGLAALSPVLELGKSPLSFLRPPVISFCICRTTRITCQHALVPVHFHSFPAISCRFHATDDLSFVSVNDWEQAGNSFDPSSVEFSSLQHIPHLLQIGTDSAISSHYTRLVIAS